MILVTSYFWFSWIFTACISNPTEKESSLKRKKLKSQEFELMNLGNRKDEQVNLDYKRYSTCKDTYYIQKNNPEEIYSRKPDYCKVNLDLEAEIHGSNAFLQKNDISSDEDLLSTKEEDNRNKFLGAKISQRCACKKVKDNYNDSRDDNLDSLTLSDPDIEVGKVIISNIVEVHDEEIENLPNFQAESVPEIQSEEACKPSIEKNHKSIKKRKSKKDSKEKISIFVRILGFLGELLL